MSDKERQNIHNSTSDLGKGLFPGTINPELRSLAERLAGPIKLLSQTQEAVKAHLGTLIENNPDLQRLVELNNGSMLTNALNRLFPERVTNARQFAFASAGYQQTEQTLILLSVDEALREQIKNAHNRAVNVIANVHKYGSDFLQQPKLFNKSVPLNPRVQMVIKVAGAFGILAVLGGAAAALASNQNHTTPTPTDLLPSTPDHEFRPTATVVKSDVPIYTRTPEATLTPQASVAVVTENLAGIKTLTYCQTREGTAFQPSPDTQAYVDKLDVAISNQGFTGDQIVYCTNQSNVVFVYDKNDLKQDPQIFMFTSENGGQLVNVSEGTMFTTPETKWIKDGLALKSDPNTDPNKLSAAHFSSGTYGEDNYFDGVFIYKIDPESLEERIVAIAKTDQYGKITTITGHDMFKKFGKVLTGLKSGIFSYEVPENIKSLSGVFSYIEIVEDDGTTSLRPVITSKDGTEVYWPQSQESYDNQYKFEQLLSQKNLTDQVVFKGANLQAKDTLHPLIAYDKKGKFIVVFDNDGENIRIIDFQKDWNSKVRLNQIYYDEELKQYTDGSYYYDDPQETYQFYGYEVNGSGAWFSVRDKHLPSGKLWEQNRDLILDKWVEAVKIPIDNDNPQNGFTQAEADNIRTALRQQIHNVSNVTEGPDFTYTTDSSVRMIDLLNGDPARFFLLVSEIRPAASYPIAQINTAAALFINRDSGIILLNPEGMVAGWGNPGSDAWNVIITQAVGKEGAVTAINLLMTNGSQLRERDKKSIFNIVDNEWNSNRIGVQIWLSFGKKVKSMEQNIRDVIVPYLQEKFKAKKF